MTAAAAGVREAEVAQHTGRRNGRTPVGPLDYSRRLWLRLTFGLTLLFLYAPIITLMVFSFNDSRRNIVWRGFTLKYYEKAFDNDSLIQAFTNSLTIALVSTLVSVVLGAMVAVLLWRFHFPGKAPYEGAVALPIVVPEICMGVAMLVFFARIGWPSGLVWPFNLGAITIAHISFSFPFVAMVVRARLVNFNRELEEAARDLGATEWQTFRDVLIPFMRPGLVA
ncbi:MAG: ABC transporter permease, partial [Geminicoccales bacterium]